MTIAELKRIKEWAEDKISSGEEPPWSWYQHMKLIEALDAITTGMESTRRLRLVTDEVDPIHVNLPM